LELRRQIVFLKGPVLSGKPDGCQERLTTISSLTNSRKWKT
jgi:hypothetical protein